MEGDKRMTKKKFILITDLLVTVFLIIQLQSTICYILEHIAVLHNRSIYDYLTLYSITGLEYAIHITPFGIIISWLVVITFFSNIAVIVIKIIDMFRKEEKLIRGLYRYFIIINILFVILKIIYFDSYITMLMSV